MILERNIWRHDCVFFFSKWAQDFCCSSSGPLFSSLLHFFFFFFFNNLPFFSASLSNSVFAQIAHVFMKTGAFTNDHSLSVNCQSICSGWDGMSSGISALSIINLLTEALLQLPFSCPSLLSATGAEECARSNFSSHSLWSSLVHYSRQRLTP